MSVWFWLYIIGEAWTAGFVMATVEEHPGEIDWWRAVLVVLLWPCWVAAAIWIGWRDR
jgi:hypothetical protein